jgi:hypothetical protein
MKTKTRSSVGSPECVMCDEPITNPICPACLQEGVQQWLLEQGQDALVLEVQELTRGTFANIGLTFCIKCDSVMSLCAYCYTKEVFSIVKEHPRLVENYLEYFNYDLEHLGWEQDARAYIN